MEQRRTRRFSANLPMHIFRLNGRRANRAEETLDISSGGICFRTEAVVDAGARVEYVITLTAGPPRVQIRCAGRVLRVQRRNDRSDAFAVAASLDRYQFVRTETWDAAARVSALA